MTLKEEAERSAWKRNYLKVLLGLMGVVVLVAMVGIVFVGVHEQEYVILPAMGDGFLLVMAFCALPGMDRKGVRVVAAMGIGMALLLFVAFPVCMGMVWFGESLGGRRPIWTETMGNVIATGMVVASMLCLVAFVAAPRLKGFGRWTQIITVGALVLGSGLLVSTFWTSRDTSNLLDTYIMGSIVLSAAGTLGVMVLNRFFAIPVVDVLSDVDQTVFLRCPRCLKEQEVAVGEAACAGCGLRIEIAIEEPKCPQCRYNLRGLREAVCPECGLDLRGGGAAGAAGNGISRSTGAGDVMGPRALL